MLASLEELSPMIFKSLSNNFATYLTAFALASVLVLAVWYTLYVYKPYAKFPACRFEHRILYFILKRKPFNRALLQTFIEQSKRYQSEGAFVAWLGVPFLTVYEGEIVKMILNEPTATDKPSIYRMVEYAVGKGILTSNGETYKKHLKMIAPAFNAAALKSYTTLMNEHSEEMIRRISELDGQPTDDIEYIVGICSIGILEEMNVGRKEKNLKEYTHIIKVLNKTAEFWVQRFSSPWLYFDFALQFFPSAREAHRLISNLLRDSLKPRLEEIKESLISRQASAPDLELNDSKRLKTIGESFVRQHLKDPTITMDEVTRQISLVAGAGFDTLTHTLKFALFLLGQHQDVQDWAAKEVTTETEGHVTYDDLQRLTYLECVIKETLRLYPVIPVFGRKLNKELQCGEYKLPRNSSVLLFPYMLHRNPEIFTDPEKFDPERFMDKNSKIKPWNYIPFAEGLRPCPGKLYAVAQMKIVLAHVLRNFRIISLDRKEEVEVTWSAVLDCTRQLRMQFLPRTLSD